MAAKKMTPAMKRVEGSKRDMAIDKRRGLKEGSPADIRSDRAQVAARKRKK